MSEWFYLRLAEVPEGTASWLAPDVAGPHSVHSGTLAAAAAAAAGARLCVLVPATEVLAPKWKYRRAPARHGFFR